MTTDAPPTTLAAFLLARIGEDEEVARWALEDPKRQRNVGPQPTIGRLSYEGGWGSDLEVLAPPRLVLAECEAKRRIVDRWQGNAAALRLHSTSEATTRAVNELTEVLRLLAQPYRDHPDFRPEWRA